MKSIAFLLLCCLGFMLLSGMVNDKRRNSMSSWVKLNGSDGQDISVNDKGEFFLVNTVGKLYKYEGPNWKQITSYKSVRFYVENKGVVLRLADGCLFKFDCTKSKSMAVSADCNARGGGDRFKDMTIGSDSTIWELYDNDVWGSKCGNSFAIPGPGFSRIAAGGGQVWVINNKGLIYQLKDPKHLNMGWEQRPGGGARDITVTNDGYVFIVDNKGRIYQWTGFRWDPLDGSDGLRISANNRKIVLINTQREMYTRNY
jgi:hypothetical protein